MGNHLPPGGTISAARREYRLAYRSQRITTLDRSHDRQRRLCRQLGADYEHLEQPPQNFHEHDEQKKFFYDHFVVKGACWGPLRKRCDRFMGSRHKAGKIARQAAPDREHRVVIPG